VTEGHPHNADERKSKLSTVGQSAAMVGFEVVEVRHPCHGCGEAATSGVAQCRAFVCRWASGCVMREDRADRAFQGLGHAPGCVLPVSHASH
jgi:hypothetical protein